MCWDVNWPVIKNTRGEDMKKHIGSFSLIAGVYLVAIAGGIMVFHMTSGLSLVIRLLLADLAATAIIWLISLLVDNASLYDPYWSVIPPVLLVLVAFHLHDALSDGVIVLLLALAFWGIRLTYNWARNWHGFKHQDWRYDEMRQKTPRIWPLTSLLGIQLFPTLIVFIQLIAAIRLIEVNPGMHPGLVIGSAIIMAATILQYVADRQMFAFRQQNTDTKACFAQGLWRYSRHPNYFGEIMVWWGLWLAYALTMNTIDLLVLSPVAMTLLFVFVSIPWMEKKILATRPEYADIQASVSMLFPLPPKREKMAFDDR